MSTKCMHALHRAVALFVCVLASTAAAEPASVAAALDRCIARTAISALTTGLPLPRFVSLRYDEVNVRRGPAHDQTIDWVFERKSLPVMIVSEHKHWRQICDYDGATGWVHYSQLSAVRAVLVMSERAPLRIRQERSARRLAEAEKGAVLTLNRCVENWCLIQSGPYKGWVDRTAVWGVFDDESWD